MGRRNVKPKGGKKERDVFETANPVGEFDGIQSSESSEEEGATEHEVQTHADHRVEWRAQAHLAGMAVRH